MTNTIYETPTVSVEIFSIEQGFAQSNLVGGQTKLVPQSARMRITSMTFKTAETMKRLIKTAAVIAFSLFAASCVKETINEPSKEGRVYRFIVETKENAAVKSFIDNNFDGTYTPKWSKDDELAIFVGKIDNNTKKPTAILKNTNEEGIIAKFEGKITGITETGQFKSFAPASAFQAGLNSTSKSRVGINLASVQKPSRHTIDQSCDVLVAQEASYSATNGEIRPADLFFKRMFSIVKVNLNGPELLNGQKLKEFSITAPKDTILTGRAAIDLAKASIEKWTVENNVVTALYLGTDGPVFGENAQNSNNAVWLVVNPTTIKAGVKLTFSGESEDYSFSKEVTLPKDLSFPESQLAVINLSLTAENCEEKQIESRIFVENFRYVTEKGKHQPNVTGVSGTGVSENLKYVYIGDNTDIRFNNNGHSSSNPYLYIVNKGSFTVENIVVEGETSLTLSAQVRTLQNTSNVKLYYKESSATEWSEVNGKFEATTKSFDTVQKLDFTISSTVKSLDLKFVPSAVTLVDDIVLEKTGGSTPGGETPGGETPGGDSQGGETPGGNTPGGSQTVLDKDWLELASIKEDGTRYVVNTSYADGKRNYTVFYDTEMMTPLWTAYPLNSSHMGNTERPKDWSYNPDIDEKSQIKVCDGSYTAYSGYSRGHMCPNASRNGNKTMQLQTFYVTNQVPQVQDSFNSGVWSALEGEVQKLAKNEEIFVTTGVSFHKGNETPQIQYISPEKHPDQRVPIPPYFYKLVLRVKYVAASVTDASCTAFWFENRAYTQDQFHNYSCSVDQVEEWTGFDFFVNLPDEIENVAEAKNISWSQFVE